MPGVADLDRALRSAVPVRMVRAPARESCEQVTALDRDVWLSCIGVRRGGRAALFHSADAGRHWRAFAPRDLLRLPYQIAALEPGRALGSLELDDPGDASLIAFEAGGAAWRQV